MENLPGAVKPPWRNEDGVIPIPATPPVLVLFQAWRDIYEYRDTRMAHGQIIGTFRPEMVTRIPDEMLSRCWFFLYEVKTAHLLSLLRFPIGGDRLLIHGINPALDAILKIKARVRVKLIESIYVESFLESQGTINKDHLRRKAMRNGSTN